MERTHFYVSCFVIFQITKQLQVLYSWVLTGGNKLEPILEIATQLYYNTSFNKHVCSNLDNITNL